MVNRNQFLVFAVSFLLVGFFLLATAKLGISGDTLPPPLEADHLKCYMVKDPAMLNVKGDKTLVDLFPSQEQFGIENCTIEDMNRFFCIPVAKEVIEPEDGNSESFVPDVVTSLTDRICYQIKCPPNDSMVPESLDVNDQFGRRNIENFNARYLCTPAWKTDQPCGQRAVCGGTCLRAGGAEGTCRPINPTSPICRCLSEEPVPPGPVMLPSDLP